MRKSLISLITTLPIVISSLTYAIDNEHIIHNTASWTITVYSQNYSYWITIQDKNLWAKNIGDYWDFFQRWNNNWNSWDSIISTDLLVRNSGYDNKGYVGVNNWFILLWNGNNYTNTNYDIWADNKLHDNLWWGWSDNEEQQNIVKWYDKINHVAINVNNRQWPCEEWYHVPSAWEWQELMMLRCNTNPDICSRSVIGTISTQNGEYEWANYLSNNGIWTAFSSDLLLPFAGDRIYYDGTVYDQDNYAFYWSSSPRGGFYLEDAWLLILSHDDIDPSFNRNRALGQSIRCFKNSYVKFPKTLNLSFISDNIVLWTWKVIENMTWTIPEKAKNAIKTGYILEYRYWSWTDSTTKFDFENEIITQEMATNDSSNVYFIAKWTKIETKPSWSYSGRWTNKETSKETKKKEDNNYIEKKSSISPQLEQSNWKNNTSINKVSTEWRETNEFSEEFKQAYEFAHKKQITTMPTIEKANMKWKLTRIAMAKMLSQYAINLLWQKPANIIVPKFNDITEELDKEYNNGVSLAYQFWIMWINMPDNNFRPNDEVTRAEFATALSRMLYHTPDWKPYYTTHLEKLKAEWIITNNNPKMKELRGYVMIMLMRSAK